MRENRPVQRQMPSRAAFFLRLIPTKVIYYI